MNFLIQKNSSEHKHKDETFTMNTIDQPGLEVNLHNGSEVVAQSDGNRNYTGSSETSKIALSQPDPPFRPVSKTSRSKYLGALTVIATLCLAVALGVGLGVGLATKRKSSTSR